MSSAEPNRVKQKVADVLESEWQESYETRELDVPKPQIYVEGDVTRRSVTLNKGDALFIMDGGGTVEGASLGHRDERLEIDVDVQVQTKKGEERLEGKSPAENDYGGLVGEVKRLRDKYRVQGVGNFNRWMIRNYTNDTGSFGAGRWVSVLETRLVADASPIKQDPIR